MADNNEPLYKAPGSFVLGNVICGENVSIWFNAVVRADGRTIRIGKNSNIQDNCTLHIEHDNDIVIGENVSIGHNAIIHGCTIGDNCIVGMGAIIMNRAVIGKNCIIGAGTVVTEDVQIPDNSLVVGVPGRVKRELSEEEIKSINNNAAHYVNEAKKYASRF